jgi:hypothetical protein
MDVEFAVAYDWSREPHQSAAGFDLTPPTPEQRRFDSSEVTDESLGFVIEATNAYNCR